MAPANVDIRSEIPGDEDAIDAVICRAFGRMDEAHLVRLLRIHYPPFDRRYSVTAWEADQMVGHALFTAARIHLMGGMVKALALAPIAVIPERQGLGIGAHLIRYGHELGRRDGFALALVIGHPSYYPRHAYRPCFGFAKVTIRPEALPSPSCTLSAWPVGSEDLPWLVECSAREWADVDFSWQWGAALGEWTLPGTNAVIWRTEDGRRAGYSLGWPGRKQWKMILAEDPALARDVIATIRPEGLEQHPSGWLARNVLDRAWAGAEVTSSPAAMACELLEGALEAYLGALAKKKRLPGCGNWPLPFMLC